MPKLDLASVPGANDSDAPVALFAVSLPERSTVHYPDIAIRWSPGDGYAAE